MIDINILDEDMHDYQKDALKSIKFVVDGNTTANYLSILVNDRIDSG